MPSHVHLIISAKENSQGLSAIIRDMKKHVSKEILKWTMNSRKESRKEWLEVVFKYHAKHNKNNSVYQVWQQNNHPKVLLHPRFTMKKLDYIHYNPVAAGIVSEAEHYLYSSARNYAELDETIIDVIIIDYGIQTGYVHT